MSQKEIHGVIDQQHINRKTDYLFRVSIKGLVYNDEGKVLVVKEVGREWWDLPGGGMDHKESIKSAIARELKEEVNLSGDFTYQVIAVEEPMYLENPNMWQMRLIFAIKPINMIFEPGEDADEVTFIDPSELKDSDSNAERRVYEYSQLIAHS